MKSVQPVPPNRRTPKEAPPPDVLADAEARATPTGAPKGPGKGARVRAILSILQAIVGIGLAASIAVAVAWGTRSYVRSSPRFGVSEIVVTGARFRTRDQIAEQAGIAKGLNVFSVDLDLATQKLLEDPWIFEAQLSRRLPGTVFVQVTEREAGALVALGQTYLVARDGEIFKRLEPGDPVDLPIVTGVSTESVAEDREGVKQTLRRAMDLSGDYERSALGAKAALQEIHIGGDGAVTLVVGASALQLSLGEPPYRKKLDQAARVLTELERRGSKADAILLDNEARPERVVVRMR